MTMPRGSGLLLHISSLPSAEGIGTLGREAFRWIDRLAGAGQRSWQFLPLGPTGYGNSPYQSYSAFAGNPLLIDLELLREQGWLEGETQKEGASDSKRVDYERLRPCKEADLRRACRLFHERAPRPWRERFRAFELAQVAWLEDYALFMTLHRLAEDQPWNRWEEDWKHRDPGAMEQIRREAFDEIEYRKIEQFFFFEQWEALRKYAKEKGITLIGDLPIYVSYDSSDCWAHPEIFSLDERLEPAFVAGVPPDYFSETGQLWGNPLYDWERLEATGYRWWIERLEHCFRLFDWVRIDHFRGFEAYWSIPAGAETAREGEWRPGPGEKFFQALEDALGDLPLIAEDLGIITPQVEALRDRFALPGMKVLQFAFDGNPSNPYLPHNHRRRCVLYTGTHDNDTLMGWFQSLSDRRYVLKYLDCSGEDFLWTMLRSQQCSVAAMAILPLQDLLGLGSEARMNVPGTAEGNWEWRCTPDQMAGSAEAFERLGMLSRLYGRV